MSSWRKALSYTKGGGKSIPGRQISICKGPVVGNELDVFKEQQAGQQGWNGSSKWESGGR